MRRRLLVVSLAGLLFCGPLTDGALAASRSKIVVVNVSVQAGATLASALVHKKVHGVRDVVRCLLAGSAAGIGFYESKRLMGADHTAAGWTVANLAGSLAENAAAGRNPVSQFGYTIGPLRVRVPMPWSRDQADSYVYLDVSAYQTVQIIRAAVESDGVSFRGGLLSFRRNRAFTNDLALGATYGIFPVLWDRDDLTWDHESVHAVQSLQLDVVEPSFRLLTFGAENDGRTQKRKVRFEHVKVGLFNLANDALLATQSYEDQWVEIEAFELTNDAFYRLFQ